MKPILFSTPMVQAIQSGTKTMTRRIMKEQPTEQLYPCGTGKQYWANNPEDLKAKYYKARYEIDDILWVRETWKWEGETKYTDVWPVGTFLYKADFEKGEGPCKWISSRFMPKEAARIFLKVTDVKAERLQGISEEDAMKEGYTYADWHKMNEDAAGMSLCSIPGKPILWFRELWESINGKGSWEKNPWVWCYSFYQIQKP